MTLLLLWSQPARTEFDAIDAHHGRIDTAQADRIGDAIIAAANFLTDWPLAGPGILKTTQRKWRVKATPYILLYRPDHHVLRILHVVHDAQDWQRFI